MQRVKAIQGMLNANSPEDVESTLRCTNNHSRYLGMPVNLLDVRLTLVDKQQLRRNIRVIAL